MFEFIPLLKESRTHNVFQRPFSINDDQKRNVRARRIKTFSKGVTEIICSN